MNKIVHTYYEPVEKMNNQTEILEVCKSSWTRFGWEFKITSEEDAKKHPKYEEYKKIISQLPSVNPGLYDYHCFMRWLSMVVVGGGIMIDYDVVNMGITDPNFFNYDKLIVYQVHVPCVVSGKSDDYLEITNYFCKLYNDSSLFQIINKKPHTSDMIMLSSKKIPFYCLNVVGHYPSSKSLVHCSADSCGLAKRSKLNIMKELLNKEMQNGNV